MSESFTQSNFVKEQLDDDLEEILGATQSLFQSFIKTQRDLKSAQLDTKLVTNELNTLKQRIKSDQHGDLSDWKQFSQKLNNIVQTVSDRKDIAEYERKIATLAEDNIRLKQQLANLNAQHTKEIEQEKRRLKQEHDREKTQYTKQVSELMIHKELAASEASIRYDQLQFKMHHAQQDSEQRYSSMVTQYEKLLQSLSEQKQKLREENTALQKREQKLLNQLDHIQNHSTDYLLGLGRIATPVEGCQRYSEVVEIIPRVCSSQRFGQDEEDNEAGLQTGSTPKQNTIEVAEASSSLPSTNRHPRNKINTPESPQHPGMGGHIAKPRKKRKLFNHMVGEK
ncbi:centromere-associated protein E-like [Wyeomyia smithii]|uniref:centromere-associated protein E-like n=1 Tax=Wyeomyia smithii TaxID=174621 RepID=UPI002467F523|nr:centromere-associated protein E-like [Wyeomyia smithii]